MHNEETKAMPTILTLFGLRFYFYSKEHQPVYIHIEKDGNDAKIEVATRKVVYNHGIKANDMRRALEIVEMYEAEIYEKWYIYFNEN